MQKTSGNISFLNRKIARDGVVSTQENPKAKKTCVNCGARRDFFRQPTPIAVESDVLDFANAYDNMNLSVLYDDAMESTGPVVIPLEAGGVYLDYDREIKDLCTKIVTEEFFGTDNNLFEFMNAISNIFNSVINVAKNRFILEENSILFMYKGGNILRIIEKEFDRELPHIVSKRLTEIYSVDFARSDADFSIYVNPSLPDYENILDFTVTTTYSALAALRDTMTNYNTTFFEFFKFTKAVQSDVLNKYVPQFANIAAFANPNSDKWFDNEFQAISIVDATAPLRFDQTELYEGLADKKLTFENIQQNSIKMDITDDTSKHLIYASENRSLKFNKDNIHIEFHLVRAKVAFNIFIRNKTTGAISRKKIGGELIDISFPLADLAMHLFTDLDKNVHEYELTYKPGQVIKFKGYSLHALIGDLEDIILEARLPWTAGKYKKRINRLFYLYFASIFVGDTQIIFDKRTLYLTNALAIIRKLKQHLIDNVFTEEQQQALANEIHELEPIEMEKIVSKIKIIVMLLLTDADERTAQLTDCQLFIGDCERNLEQLIEIDASLTEFYTNKMKLGMEDIYKGDIKTGLL